MKVLVTGAKGFIGKNLICKLEELKKYEVVEVDIDNSNILEEALDEVEIIVHLAGVNRPQNEEDFRKGNTNLTEKIVSKLIEKNKNIPIIITSSIQADLENPYGKSKKGAEEALIKYKEKTGANISIFRLPNVFGKWCRPNYNSAIATFCNNIALGEEIWVSDESREMTLVYIDDVINILISTIENKVGEKVYLGIPIEYKKTLGEIVGLIKEFKASRETLQVSNMNDEFTKKLYSTYLSYLSKENFSYELKMNIDNRGSFTEFIKNENMGQVSVNISKPGIIKGNHWHHTKNEKFLVVSGKGIIKFRKIGEEEIIEYKVSGEKLEVVDIPVGYTHNIINTGEHDMVTIMWVNESFNSENPDTIFLEVE